MDQAAAFSQAYLSEGNVLLQFGGRAPQRRELFRKQCEQFVSRIRIHSLGHLSCWLGRLEFHQLRATLKNHFSFRMRLQLTIAQKEMTGCSRIVNSLPGQF
jgi:hypothetical protein